MTGYHISIGYNSGCTADKALLALREIVDAICREPEKILEEVRRIEGYSPELRFAESYRQPWKDRTIFWTNETDDAPAQICQLASGGDYRDEKESMRRAFCRLVIEAMHTQKMEVNLCVA